MNNIIAIKEVTRNDGMTLKIGDKIEFMWLGKILKESHITHFFVDKNNIEHCGIKFNSYESSSCKLSDVKRVF